MSHHSNGCSKSELNLQIAPPIQNVILDDYIIESRPTDPNNSSLEFNFGASTDDYSDLSQCFLSLEMKVMKSDGSVPAHYSPPNATTGVEAEGDDIDGVPISLIAHSIWKQVDLYLNDDLVASELDYPYTVSYTHLTLPTRYRV